VLNSEYLFLFSKPLLLTSYLLNGLDRLEQHDCTSRRTNYRPQEANPDSNADAAEELCTEEGAHNSDKDVYGDIAARRVTILPEPSRDEHNKLYKRALAL
jgi:hypothetical protein